MTNEQNSPARSGNVIHLPKTLFLKVRVADCEDFIDQKNVGLEMGCDREGKPDVHPTGVTFYRCIDKLFDLGKRDDFVEFLVNLVAAHAKNGAVKKNILPARKFG